MTRRTALGFLPESKASGQQGPVGTTAGLGQPPWCFQRLAVSQEQVDISVGLCCVALGTGFGFVVASPVQLQTDNSQCLPSTVGLNEQLVASGTDLESYLRAWRPRQGKEQRSVCLLPPGGDSG